MGRAVNELVRRANVAWVQVPYATDQPYAFFNLNINQINSPRAHFGTAQTRSRNAHCRDADCGRRRAALHLTLRRAVKEQIWRRPVAEEGLQVARRVQRRVVVTGQREGDVDGRVPVIGAADAITVGSCWMAESAEVTLSCR